MLQEEHRKKIIEINSMDISQVEKNKRIQELMNPKKEEIIFKDKKKVIFCQHYKRYNYPLASCCNKVYPCRLCHDENEDHIMNRHQVKFMKCDFCKTLQEPASSCNNPDCYQFKKNHKYFCKICNLWSNKEDMFYKLLNSILISDINTSFPTYHCDKCGICRLGKKEEHKHCNNCNLCLPLKTFDNHVCKLDIKGENCPICLKSLWNTQNETIKILDCGHCVHSKCFLENIHSGNYYCAICKKSMIDLTDLWKQIDAALESHTMPDEFKDWTTDIYCNDCEKKSNTKYHFSYHKCQECGGYNTVIDNVNKTS